MKISVSGSVTILAHDAVEPFVVKYLPELPVCEGRASTVDQASPLAVLESALRYCPLVPTATLTTVSAALAAIRSPFASTIVDKIALPINAALAAAELADVKADDADVAAELALVAAEVADVAADAALVAAADSLTAADAVNVATLRYVVVVVSVSVIKPRSRKIPEPVKPTTEL